MKFFFIVLGLPLGDAKRLDYYFHFRPSMTDTEENDKSRNVSEDERAWVVPDSL